MKKTVRILVVAAFVAGIGFATWSASTVAQEAAPPAAAEANIGDDEAGRLPPGYTVVVTKEQRAKIYSIQDTYQKQLDVLKKQIAQLESKRDQEIESLLDDEQKKIIAYVLKLRDRERRQEKDATSGGN